MGRVGGQMAWKAKASSPVDDRDDGQALGLGGQPALQQLGARRRPRTARTSSTTVGVVTLPAGRHQSGAAGAQGPEGHRERTLAVQEQLLVRPQPAFALVVGTQRGPGVLVHRAVHPPVRRGRAASQVRVEHVADQVVRVDAVGSASHPRTGLQPCPHLGHVPADAARRAGPGWSARRARTAPWPARGRRRVPRRPAGSRARPRDRARRPDRREGRPPSPRRPAWPGSAGARDRGRRAAGSDPRGRPRARAAAGSAAGPADPAAGRRRRAPPGVGPPGCRRRVPTGEHHHDVGRQRGDQPIAHPGVDRRQALVPVDEQDPRPVPPGSVQRSERTGRPPADRPAIRRRPRRRRSPRRDPAARARIRNWCSSAVLPSPPAPCTNSTRWAPPGRAHRRSLELGRPPERVPDERVTDRRSAPPARPADHPGDRARGPAP